MELHGGEISVTSEGLGKGTCFSVELPLASNQTITDTPLNTDLRASTASRGIHHLRVRSKVESVFTGSLCILVEYLNCCGCFLHNRAGLVGRLSRSRSRVENGPEPAINSPLNRTPLSIDMSLNFPTKCTVEDKSGRTMQDYSPNNKRLSTRDRRYGNILISDICEKEDDATVTEIPKMRGYVLIVDDVPLNRRMLKRLLLNRFDECMEAENGQQAVDMVKEAMASGIHYDVITMDYQMPVMDGVDATLNIRKLGFKGQIIGVTGNALSEDVNTFLANGANIVLTKPLSITKFDEYLSSIITQHGKEQCNYYTRRAKSGFE